MWVSNRKKDAWEFLTAEELEPKVGMMKVRVGAETDSPDALVPDKVLRLLAWILTDSHVKGNTISFYQRASNAHVIRNLLLETGLDFTERVNSRRVKYICGKRVKTQEDSHVFYLAAKHGRELLDSLEHNKNRLPSWFFSLSARQLQVFLREVIETDGSYYRGNKNLAVIYCSRSFLRGQLLALAALAGWRASESLYGAKRYGKINICMERDSIAVQNVERVPYSGLVWCLSNRNGTLITRRNGRVAVVGNCWMDRLLTENPALQGTLSWDRELDLTKRGWKIYPYHAVVPFGKLYVTHGDQILGKMTGSSNAAKKLVEYYRRNIVAGHLHTTQSYTLISPIDRHDIHVGSLVPCLASRAPSYMKKAPNSHVCGWMYGWLERNGNFSLYTVKLVDGEARIGGEWYTWRKGK